MTAVPHTYSFFLLFLTYHRELERGLDEPTRQMELHPLSILGSVNLCCSSLFETFTSSSANTNKGVASLDSFPPDSYL